MEIIEIIGIVLTGASLFSSLVRRKKVTEKAKDQFLYKLGPMIEEMKFCKLVDNNIVNFCAEDITHWATELKETDDLGAIESIWKVVQRRYDRNIAREIKPRLPKMKEIAKKRLKLKPKDIPLEIIIEAESAMKIYPQFIECLEEFFELIEAQTKEIFEDRSIKNICKRTEDILTKIEDVKNRADGLIINFVDILIFAYGRLKEGTK